MGKDYAVRLRCPYGDEETWVTLRGREETLEQILSESWDFECSLHGVQKEIPIEASEKLLPSGSGPQRKGYTAPTAAKAGQRASKRRSIRLPVLAYGWTRSKGVMHEETFTILVNAGGGLVGLTTKVELGDTVFLVNKTTREEQECRVAYVAPAEEDKLTVGLGFKRQAPSFWRFNPHDPRIERTLRVWVHGRDRNGNPFSQTAYTMNISRSGARLDGVGYLTKPGDILELRRHWRKARFRVVWTGQVGTADANQIGICSLEPNNYIWDVNATSLAAAGTGAVSAPSFVPPWAKDDRPREESALILQSGRLGIVADREVPVVVRWIARDGVRHEEEATALVISGYGCVLHLKAAITDGMTLELRNRTSKEIRRAKVVWCGAVDPEGRQLAAIELEKPDPQFWEAAVGAGIRKPT